jgi:hypothetical protein
MVGFKLKDFTFCENYEDGIYAYILKIDKWEYIQIKD